MNHKNQKTELVKALTNNNKRMNSCKRYEKVIRKKTKNKDHIPFTITGYVGNRCFFSDLICRMRVGLYIGIILTGVTIICAVVAVALPYWLYDDSTVKRYEGLWVECRKSEATEQCKYKYLPPRMYSF